MSVLYEKMKIAAQNNAQKTAVVFYGKRYNYAKILSLVERAAAGLGALGVKKGSVVTLCMPNTPSAMIAFYAINRLGAVINLVHPFVSAEGLAESLKKTGSDVVVVYDLFLRDKGAEFALKLEELKKRLNTDINIFVSNSEYFMNFVAKTYFKIFQKKRKRKKTKTGRLQKVNPQNSSQNDDGNIQSGNNQNNNNQNNNNQNNDIRSDNIQNGKAQNADAENIAGAAKIKTKYKAFESFFKFAETTVPPAETAKNEPAVYLPSGGTAGLPKIIVHRAGVFNELCEKAQFFLSEPLNTYNAMYSVLPIFHGFGLCMSMHMCAFLGVKNVMSMKFNPKSVAKAIPKERINVIMGVPAMFSRLLSCPHFLKTDLSSMRECFVGGDTVPKGLAEGFSAALKNGGSNNGRLYPGYGLTETVAVCTVNCASYNKADSVGYPLPDSEIAVVKDGKRAAPLEIGEICVKTPLVMLGYLDVPDACSANGAAAEAPIRDFEDGCWLFTGDLGFLDNDGFLFFKQRIKNMIKVNGVPVYPCEIEETVENIPWVKRAAAVGIPHKNSGEAVKLYVEAPAKELKKFFEKYDTDALKAVIIAECEKKLIRYAVPREIEIKEALPLNLIGKVDRKKLK